MSDKIKNAKNKIKSFIKIGNNKNSQKNLLQILSEKSKKIGQLTSKYKKILLLTLLLAGGGVAYHYLSENKKGNDKTIENLKGLDEKEIENFRKNLEKIGINELTDIYSYYLDGSPTIKVSSINKTKKIDPKKNIKNCYQKKFNRKNHRDFKVAKDHYANVISKIDFNKGPKSNIENYEKGIQEQIDLVNKNLDREKLKTNLFKNNKYKGDLFEKVCKEIDSQCLLSYNLTEFFPPDHGSKLNKLVLDFLLKEGGEEYVYYLPAMYDQYASRGPYQFTSKAIFDKPGEEGGVNKISNYLPKNLQLPGSMINLKGKDHHKAAYLFSIYNLHNLFKKQDEESLKHLIGNKNNITQLIAVGHNKPANIDNAFYFRKKMNFKGYIYQQFPNRSQFECSRKYAERTYSNFSSQNPTYPEDSYFKQSKNKQSKSKQVIKKIHTYKVMQNYENKKRKKIIHGNPSKIIHGKKISNFKH